MNAIDALGLMLRPAGGGVHVVSTGKAEQLALQRRLYGAADEETVRARWHEDLARIAGARAVLVGIPSDTGGGIQRGANLGPGAIRARLLEDDPEWPSRARDLGLVDLGDVFSVPQLLEDDMLSDGQRAATARALYPDLGAGRARPVAGLAALHRRARPRRSSSPRTRARRSSRSAAITPRRGRS